MKRVNQDMAAIGLLCMALRRVGSASIRARVREPKHWAVWVHYARKYIGRPLGEVSLATVIVCEAVGL